MPLEKPAGGKVLAWGSQPAGDAVSWNLARRANFSQELPRISVLPSL